MTSPLLNSQIVFVYKLFEIYQQVAFAFSKNIWVLFKLSIYLKIINNLFCIILLSHNIFPLNSRVLLFSSSFFFLEEGLRPVWHWSICVYHVFSLVNRQDCLFSLHFFTRHLPLVLLASFQSSFIISSSLAPHFPSHPIS